MIIDNINQIDKYKVFSNGIFDGLNFIYNSKPIIKIGTYHINDKVKAIVSEYKTKDYNELGYESHLKHIDIQYPIIGLERVLWAPTESLTIKKIYDENQDIIFYNHKPTVGSFIDIGDRFFAIFFPNDAHSPQFAVNRTEIIKKITIKISI